MNLTELETRYIIFNGKEPSSREAIAEIEDRLLVVLPEDFKAIAKFYRGGMLGGKSHHSIDHNGTAGSIVDETLRLRRDANLPPKLVVIAEPAESLIVMETGDNESSRTKVIWVDSTDAGNLSNFDLLRSPCVWPSYSAFFQYLLDEEEEERKY